MLMVDLKALLISCNMSSNSVILFSVCTLISILGTTESLCRPRISQGGNSQPDIDGYIFIECEISKCDNISKVVYEKTRVHSSIDWTPVFEGINRTDYRAVETGDQYNLENRTDYTAFRTKHLVFIKALIREDGGQWRCVVHDVNCNDFHSPALDVHIFVTPEEEFMGILPTNLEMVTYQKTQFIFTADGVYPEPDIVWEVNEAENLTGIESNYNRSDGLWFVMNTVTLSFDRVGMNELSCVMKTKTRDPWLRSDYSIDIKASARVKDISKTTNENETFTLNCIGSGYNPTLTWKKHGTTLLENDTMYLINENCNVSMCHGFIASSPIQPATVCQFRKEYSGTYTCDISLEPPYNSTETADLTIDMFREVCKESSGNTLLMIVGITGIILVLVAITVGFSVFWLKKSKKDDTAYPKHAQDNDQEMKTDSAAGTSCSETETGDIEMSNIQCNDETAECFTNDGYTDSQNLVSNNKTKNKKIQFNVKRAAGKATNRFRTVPNPVSLALDPSTRHGSSRYHTL